MGLIHLSPVGLQDFAQPGPVAVGHNGAVRHGHGHEIDAGAVGHFFQQRLQAHAHLAAQTGTQNIFKGHDQRGTFLGQQTRHARLAAFQRKKGQQADHHGQHHGSGTEQQHHGSAAGPRRYGAGFALAARNGRGLFDAAHTGSIALQGVACHQSICALRLCRRKGCGKPAATPAAAAAGTMTQRRCRRRTASGQTLRQNFTAGQHKHAATPPENSILAHFLHIK